MKTSALWISCTALTLCVACSSSTTVAPDRGDAGAGGDNTERGGTSGEGTGGSRGGSVATGGEPQAGGTSGSAPGGAPQGGAPGGSGGDAPAGAGGAPQGGAPGGSGGDAPGGDGGAGGQPPATWCDTQSADPGIAGTDFQCLDFNEELPPETTWQRQEDSGGTLTRITTLATSLPASLSADVDALGVPGQTAAALTWAAVGANDVVRSTVSAELNPKGMVGPPLPWNGRYELLCVNTSGSSVCLTFKTGEGYAISWNFTAGAAIANFCPVSQSLKADSWTRVELVVEDSGATLSYDDTEVVTCPLEYHSVPTVNVHVGLTKSFGDGVAPWNVAYDDVIAFVER